MDAKVIQSDEATPLLLGRSDTGQRVRPTHVRLEILALITIATAINYTSRTVLGVVVPFMRKDMHIDATMIGVIFSAFSLSYSASQIPAGIFLDRFGSRLTYFLSLTIWSLFTLLQAFAGSVGALLGLRIAIGVAEAPCFPTNSRVVSAWFPQKERALATGVYSVGEYVGLAFLSPVLFWITAQFGWQALFAITGAIGIVHGVIWWFSYREPHQSRRVNDAELAHIKAGGGGSTAVHTPVTWARFRRLISRRQIIGAAIGQFSCNCILVFFLTWFPTYLSVTRHMNWVALGYSTSLPFVAGAIGVLLGGFVSDMLLRRTESATLARKVPMVAGFLLAATIGLASVAGSDAAVIAIMSLAFFGQGMLGLGWTVITDVAPKNGIGLASGVFNLTSNLGGIITPLLIGVVLSRTGSFTLGLAFISVMSILGAAAYLWILGPVERVDID